MENPTHWMIALMALVGHGGIHIAIYNRINGIGWSRKFTKRMVKFFLATTVLIPTSILMLEGDAVWSALTTSSPNIALSTVTQAYVVLCCASWVFLGVPWLIWRPLFGVQWVRAPRRCRVFDVAEQFDHPLPLTTKATWESRLPFNQLLQLSVEEIELPVVGMPKSMDGYRMAHLSDIHLTGEIHPNYAKFAIEQANQARPDMMVVTGDIIDTRPCIDWLVEIFSPAQADDGCYFILGNHDTRVVDSWETREAMDSAGWVDLGSRVLPRTIRDVPCELIGNEYPWFARPEIATSSDVFRIVLSHSPDQIHWARKHQVKLLLAGHTHGGQGRLPLLGPVLSPSLYGSRYASGDFYRAPTTMHVTRGLGGVHLLRINCRPELSIITLRAA